MIISDLVAERQQAIHLLRSGRTVKEVAQSLNRHENWVRKWWQRYQVEGWAGLQDRSRMPHQHGRKLSAEVQQAICQARSELEATAASGSGLKYVGPLAVRTKLKDKGVSPLPSRASIERVLQANGLTRTKKGQSKSAISYPHLKPSQAQQLYQVDIVPHFLLGGERVACFNAIDVVSRYPTGHPFAQRRSQEAAEFLVQVWQEMGLPHYTQVDNEGCFTGGTTHPYVLGKVVRLALHVGTELVFSPVYHPESNGTVERFHQDYDRHVWEETYLPHRQDVQDRGQSFFDLYRHSRHHTALMEQSPYEVHHHHPPTCLASDFVLPTTKLPLREGRLHFIRRIDPDGTVKVLNSTWAVPKPDFQKGVWVTIEFKLTGATLSIYDAAPDVQERHCLVAYPFPVTEPILPYPAPTSEEPMLNSANEITDTSAEASQPTLKLLPPPAKPMSGGPEHFWVSLVTSVVRLAHRVVNTMH
ncbi:MAG: helix-turn-helix domain-containing protein [Anaerolineae bacterium]|nr:helix-turn-helix domain-containing protein [Anaerolineae bacterium]